jgi:hypothetical protein
VTFNFHMFERFTCTNIVCVDVSIFCNDDDDDDDNDKFPPKVS